MKLLILSILIVFSAVDGHFSPNDASLEFSIKNFLALKNNRLSINRESRIVGGQEVARNAHSYMTALHIQIPFGVVICGGSIVNVRAVMTAAHCLIDSSSTLIVAGAHNRHILEASQQRTTVNQARYVIHPLFNARTHNSDIAILQTSTAFVLNSQVNLVRLPTNFATELFVGESARSIGWGRTSVNGPTSSVLLQSFNEVIANAPCATVLGADRVIASTICVSTAQQPVGPCQADEGGVLSVIRAGDPRPVQIGITSFFASRDCIDSRPIGFTRVTNFLGWISQNSNPNF